MTPEPSDEDPTVSDVECRCDDLGLRELEGDEAVEYAQHLQRVEHSRGQDWLLLPANQTGVGRGRTA
jgi:hypothetical protein